MAIRKVLVVDDSKTELMFMTDLLQKHGFAVKTAEGADERGVAAAARVRGGGRREPLLTHAGAQGDRRDLGHRRDDRDRGNNRGRGNGRNQ